MQVCIKCVPANTMPTTSRTSGVENGICSLAALKCFLFYSDWVKTGDAHHGAEAPHPQVKADNGSLPRSGAAPGFVTAKTHKPNNFAHEFNNELFLRLSQ